MKTIIVTIHYTTYSKMSEVLTVPNLNKHNIYICIKNIIAFHNYSNHTRVFLNKKIFEEDEILVFEGATLELESILRIYNE